MVRALGLSLCVGSLLAAAFGARASATVLFQTGFEPFEGYDPGRDLAGQNDWIAFASDLEGNTAPLGGNGLLRPPIAGFTGQAAYIGFNAATNTADFNVWRPVNLKPQSSDLPVVRFRVVMQIEDSTTVAPHFDDFRWSAYNTLGERLFTLDFDNETLTINFVLDDDRGFQPTGFAFNNGEPYDLVITMNFARNLWTAEVNEVVVVNAAPITTRRAQLDLGDIDAVWAIRTPGQPGDNFMIFDDYLITAESVTSIPPRLVPVGVLNGNKFIVRVLGEPGVKYALEASNDFTHWTEVGQAVAQSPGGVAEFEDWFDRLATMKVYRARSVTP